MASNGAAAGLVLSFQALRRAADSGKPFQPELDALGKFAGGGVDLKALSGAAGSGAPTQAALLSQLPDVLRQARAAVERSNDETFIDRLASNAKSVVRVRRIGPVDGADDAAVLSRMEAHAGAGDMNAVVSEANKLDTAAAEAVRPWLAKARARHALDTALAALEVRIMASLASGNAGAR